VEFEVLNVEEEVGVVGEEVGVEEAVEEEEVEVGVVGIDDNDEEEGVGEVGV
jgi:hypothetical protein